MSNIVIGMIVTFALLSISVWTIQSRIFGSNLAKKDV